MSNNPSRLQFLDTLSHIIALPLLRDIRAVMYLVRRVRSTKWSVEAGKRQGVARILTTNSNLQYHCCLHLLNYLYHARFSWPTWGVTIVLTEILQSNWSQKGKENNEAWISGSRNSHSPPKGHCGVGQKPTLISVSSSKAELPWTGPISRSRAKGKYDNPNLVSKTQINWYRSRKGESSQLKAGITGRIMLIQIKAENFTRLTMEGSHPGTIAPQTFETEADYFV